MKSSLLFFLGIFLITSVPHLVLGSGILAMVISIIGLILISRVEFKKFKDDTEI